MSMTGYRDGVFNAKAIKLTQKRLKMDLYPFVLSSASVIKGSTDASATTSFTIATAQGIPRALKVVNVMGAAAERAMKLVIKGYNAEGNYAEETLTLSSARYILYN